MSVYIDILNQIKTHYALDWLTPSQRKVYDEFVAFLGPPHKVVNIYGKEGVGKTFLGWVLDKQGLAKYFPSLEDVTANHSVVIIDNAAHKRDLVRGLRNTLRDKHIHQAIIISRYRAEDSIPCFQLELTDDDVQVFKSNLFRHLDVKVPDGDFPNLWGYLLHAAGM